MNDNKAIYAEHLRQQALRVRLAAGRLRTPHLQMDLMTVAREYEAMAVMVEGMRRALEAIARFRENTLTPSSRDPASAQR